MHYDAEDQHRRFADVDDDRSSWILSTLAVALHERSVFRSLEIGAGPVLELGAGEGLALQFRPGLAQLGYVGSDLHVSRARAVRDAAASRGHQTNVLSCDAARGSGVILGAASGLRPDMPTSSPSSATRRCSRAAMTGRAHTGSCPRSMRPP